ncbi:hypothetical protein Bca101_039290 [Brassica carinata]
MANMRSSSKLLAVMLFSFVALFVISQARTFPTGRKLTDYPPKTYDLILFLRNVSTHLTVVHERIWSHELLPNKIR